MTKRRMTAGRSLRCLVIFQLKLAADAVRDLVMSPISIIMFFLDLLLAPEEENSHYAQLMQFGRQSDRWINLFEEHTPANAPSSESE
ncbi:MAG: hypothetical protein KDI28_04145 [Pseudomonadales bacterium]|nr:hypothetical protein [Pseudomonadales bacterium]